MKCLHQVSFLILFVLLLAGCAISRQDPPSPEALAYAPILNGLSSNREIPADSHQLLLVAPRPSDRAAATVTSWEKTSDGEWQQVLKPVPAMIGRAGFAPPGEKREGDGRTPSGIFALKRAFGYGAAAPTRLRYRQATAADLWVDDAKSPDYNRWVRRGETTATSFEEMRRPDDLYRYGIVIEYNTDPVVSGHGSAIFYHLWRGDGTPTAGCVAMAEADLLRILAWLDPARQPVTVIGDEAGLKQLLR